MACQDHYQAVKLESQGCLPREEGYWGREKKGFGSCWVVGLEELASLVVGCLGYCSGQFSPLDHWNYVY